MQDAMGDDRTVRRSHVQQVLGQLVHLGVAVVGDDQPFVGVEHAQTLAHVIEGRLESYVLLGECCIQRI